MADREAFLTRRLAERGEEVERLRICLEIAHGALLCIGGTDSNWSEYARNVADEVSGPLETR